MSKVSDLYFTKIVTLGEGGLKDYVYFFFNDLCVFSCSFQNIIYINFNIWESVIYHILILITDY